MWLPGFGVQGLGLGVWGVWGFGDLGFGVWGLGGGWEWFKILGCSIRDPGAFGGGGYFDSGPVGMRLSFLVRTQIWGIYVAGSLLPKHVSGPGLSAFSGITQV